MNSEIWYFIFSDLIDFHCVTFEMQVTKTILITIIVTTVLENRFDLQLKNLNNQLYRNVYR